MDFRIRNFQSKHVYVYMFEISMILKFTCKIHISSIVVHKRKRRNDIKKFLFTVN